MTIEIVDLPINSMVIFHSYVSLPEGRKGRHAQKNILHDLGLAGLCIIGDRNDQYDPVQGMYESAKRDQLMCILASGSYLALKELPQKMSFAGRSWFLYYVPSTALDARRQLQGFPSARYQKLKAFGRLVSKDHSPKQPPKIGLRSKTKKHVKP